MQSKRRKIPPEMSCPVEKKMDSDDLALPKRPLSPLKRELPHL